ncbi:hypothetical protein B0H21DRAFT_692369 [Amylocystis lapponica]|nr:hypothetical protein B0H21DRAFT_692369 [Amylocystis lapponica]
MAYPAYDTYNTQLAYPVRPSLSYGQHYSEPGYDPALTGGVYGENYPQQSYPIYAPQRTMSQYRAYDDIDIRDPYYAEGRQLSTGGAYATPYLAPRSRSRRRSSVSYHGRPPLDSYRRLSSVVIKFKHKGGFRSGITLGEAMSNVRLSGNDSYTYHDLNADHRGKIILKLRWSGYASMTYELPVDSYDGRVELQTLARRVARACVHFIQVTLYISLRFSPPPGQYTVLASFVLSNADSLKVISLATGSKCLPTSRFSKEGDALHDSHAEVLARRGALRWFLEEIQQIALSSRSESMWICKRPDGRFYLKDGVRIHFYVTTVPCGDASTRFLASTQDTEMAILKDSVAHPVLPINQAARGRDNYSLYGVLRTKPGRADSPPTLCMSCSDKIARWNVLGFQGALASRLLQPLYLADIVIGEVKSDVQDQVKEDCERAFWKRLTDLDRHLPHGFKLNRPVIRFTSVPFIHSRDSLGATRACNDSLCWLAGSTKSPEVLINGLKRGVSPKHRHNPRFRPLLSKVAILGLYEQLEMSPEQEKVAYFNAKQRAIEYEVGKTALQAPNSPFSGWLRSGVQWESFDSDGTFCGHEQGLCS